MHKELLPAGPKLSHADDFGRAAERKGQERNRGMVFGCLSLKNTKSWVMSEYSQ